MITASIDTNGHKANPYLTKEMSFDVPYIVRTTSLSEEADAIRDSGVLPAFGSSFPGNIYCKARSCPLTRDSKQPLIWRAVVTYAVDNLSQQEKDRQAFPNPCDRPVEILWNAQGYEVPRAWTVEDYTPPGGTLIKAGTAITNTALDPYDPPIVVTDYHDIVTVTKNLATVPSWYRGLCGRVNNAPYILDGFLIEKGASRIIGRQIGKRDNDNGFPFRQVQIVIELRDKRESRYPGDKVPEPYIYEAINEGYNWYASSTSKGRIKVPAHSSAGVTNISTTAPNTPIPVKLSSNGLPIDGVTYANTVFNPHCVHRTADFSLIPFLTA